MSSTTTASGMTKQELLEDICDAASLRTMHNSRGSSTPSNMPQALARRYRVLYDSMPKTAARITRAAGLAWDSTHDSQSTPSGGGSTIQLSGLRRLLEAVRLVEAESAATGRPPHECIGPARA